MKHILPFLLAACMTIFYSCSGNNNSGDNTIINVESVVGKGSIRDASDFIKEIKYIPLETTPGSMVGNIRNIIIDKEKMYVGDDKNVINIFDMNGRYLNTLNRVGRGPEEYVRLTDFKIAPNGNIFIASQGEGIVEYSADLKFIRKLTPERQEDAGFLDMIILKEGLFASNKFHFDMESGSKQVWDVYDDSLKTQFSYSADALSKTSDEGVGENRRVTVAIRINPYRYHIYNDNLNIYRAGNDTIFNIDIENNYLKSTRYVVNCGKYQFLSEMENSVDSNISELEAISLGSIVESGNYMFMNFMFRGLAPEPFETEGSVITSGNMTRRMGGGTNTSVYGVYNKKSGELSLLNQPFPKILGLKDDINGGAPFWPRSITQKQELISWHNALDLVMLAEEGKIDQSVIGNLKEDDNPVVAIAIPK